MDQDTRSEYEYLKETAPLLFEKKLSVDTSPPEGYFEGLPAKLTAGIAAEFPKKGKLRYINFGNLAAAAAVAVILALVPVLRNLTSETSAPDAFTTTALTPEEAEVMMNWYAADSDFELIEIVGTDNSTELFAELSFEDDVTDRDLENYLINEGVSAEDIAALMSEDI